MGKFTKIATIDDLNDGAMKKYQVQDQEILLARIAGKYYAVRNKCPHMGGDLSMGKLEGAIVTCPRHGSQFNLTDGSVVRWMKGSGLIFTIGSALKPPQRPVIYNTRVEGQDVLVEL
jgi:3-phenylpropionate/trans-cinnamate dioxygenase ferredoxin component